MPAKPGSYPDWTDGNASKQVEPTSGKKTLGWTSAERPPFQFMNYLFYAIGLWIRYFDAVGDLVLPGMYDAVVPDTHADINAVMADGAIPQGAKILIKSNMTVNTVQQITKNNVQIDIKPGVAILKGTAANGLQISATGVRIIGGRVANFSTGGNKGILVDAGSDFFMIGEMRFANNDSDIVDNNGKGATYALINE